MRDGPVNRLEPHWPQIAACGDMPAEQQNSWGETALSWEKNLEHLMAEHPKLTVAAAAAIGLMLGWMVKRK